MPSEGMTLEKIQAAAKMIKDMGPPVKVTAVIAPTWGPGVNPETPHIAKHRILITTEIGPFDNEDEARAYMDKHFPQKTQTEGQPNHD